MMENEGMDRSCSQCGGAFHPSTGSTIVGKTCTIQICWNCVLYNIQWYKRRIAQMKHCRKGETISFHDAAMVSYEFFRGVKYDD